MNVLPRPLKRRRVLQLALIGLVGEAASAGPLQASSSPVWRRAGLAFGTTVSITLEGVPATAAEPLFDVAFAEIRHVERVASLTRSDSEVCRLNTDGVLRNPDPALLDMLRLSQTLNAASDGAFDVTVQPLWRLYDDYARRGSWPSAQEAAPARALIGQHDVQLADDLIRFARPGMAITLNGVAQGYAADRVAAALSARGVRRAFLDTGELEALGTHADGRPWLASIRHPRHTDQTIATTSVRGALATSGDYEYFWSADFARNHILDPHTGDSPTELASVSVLAPTGLLADALSTTIFVLGPQRGLALLPRFEAHALAVTKSGRVLASPGFPYAALA